MSETVGTTHRILAALRLLAETKGTLSVKDVSQSLALPMSTSHRMLDMLMEAGFVEKDTARRRYGIGMEFFRIANLVAQNPVVAATLQPALDELTRRTGESSVLSIYLPADHAMTFVAKSDSPDSLRFEIDLFGQRQLVWGATGLAILAFLPKTVQDAAFDKAVPSPVSGKVLSRKEFDARIAKARRDGVAVTENENLSDSVGIAAPLTGGPDRVIGSVALTIPRYRYDRTKAALYAELLIRAATGLAGKGALLRTAL